MTHLTMRNARKCCEAALAFAVVLVGIALAILVASVLASALVSFIM